MRNLFLVKGDEELGVLLDLLMEELNNILRDELCQEAHFETLPKFDYYIVEVERVLIFFSVLVCMLGFRNQNLDARTIKRGIEHFVSLGH